MITSPPDPLHACAFSLHSLSYVLPSLPHTCSPDDGHSSSRGQRHSWWPLALTKQWEFGAKHFTKSQITVENKHWISKWNKFVSLLVILSSVRRPVSQSVSQSISHSVRQSVIHSVSQSVSPSVSQSFIHSFSQSVSHSFIQSVSQSFSHSVSPSVSHSVRPSVRQTVLQSVRQSVSPSIRPSFSQSVSQSVIRSVSQSVSQSVRQSVRPLFSSSQSITTYCLLTTITPPLESDFPSCFTRLGLHNTLVQVAPTIRTADQVYFPRTVSLGRTYALCLVVLHFTCCLAVAVRCITRSCSEN